MLGTAGLDMFDCEFATVAVGVTTAGGVGVEESTELPASSCLVDVCGISAALTRTTDTS